MGKHEELLKHRKISKINLMNDGSLLIKFKDESHTWIEPDIFDEIVDAYNDLKEEHKIQDLD